MEDYKDAEKLTEQMKAGLAKLFADEDIRAYIRHCMYVYNHNVLVATRAGNSEVARDYTSRFDTMTKMFDNGKLMFSKAERLKTAPLEELVKENEKQDEKSDERV